MTGSTLDVETAASEIRAFLSGHPALLVREQGEVVLRLEGEQSGYSLAAEHGKLVLHAWSPERSLMRRVVGWQARSGRLLLECLRLGQVQPLSLLLEPAGVTGELARTRSEFRQGVLGLLQREWPQWKMAPGWSRTGSTPVQRFVLHRGQRQVVCVAVSEQESVAMVEGALAQALLLAEDAGARHPRMVLQAVRLILPPGEHDALRFRVLMLRPSPPVELYVLERSGSRLFRLDAADVGNLDTRLGRAPEALLSLPAAAQELLQEIQSICPAASAWRTPEGLVAFRLYGLEFAREALLAGSGRCGFQFGVGREVTALEAGSRPMFHALLRQLRRQRHPAGDRRQAWFGLRAEAWMESLLQARPDRIDALVDPRWAYSQTPIFRSACRDVLDLLVARRDGTLVIYELKAEEDLDLPLQGLDYWLRVRCHQQRGDFERMGYFPGLALRATAPLLLLIYPALRRHPRMDDVLRWISPEVPILRIGVNEEWRQDFSVIDRRGGREVAGG